MSSRLYVRSRLMSTRVVLLVAVVCSWNCLALRAFGQFGATGPDQFGHLGNVLPYGLRDIRSTGALLVAGDDSVVNLPLGFNFDYFGTTFSSVNVSANGFVSFTSTSDGCCVAGTLPGGGGPDMIAAAWSDLDPTEGGQTYFG